MASVETVTERGAQNRRGAETPESLNVNDGEIAVTPTGKAADTPDAHHCAAIQQPLLRPQPRW